MLGEPDNRFSLTRAALSTSGRTQSNYPSRISVLSLALLLALRFSCAQALGQSPPTLAIQRQGADCMVSWLASSDQVLQAADRLEGPWMAIAAPIVGGGAVSITQPMLQAQRFYRLCDIASGVCSANMVAYVNWAFPPGESAMTIPMLKMASHEISEVLPGAPENSSVRTSLGTENYFGFGAWLAPWMLLPAGERITFYNPGPSGWFVSFVGEVILVAPHVVVEPASLTILEGEDARLGAVASGTPLLAYQWLHDGKAIVGATRATLELTRVPASSQGTYSVIVTNLVGPTSDSAQLAVISPITKVSPPTTNAALLTVECATNLVCVVEASDSLEVANWLPVYTNTTPFTYFDPGSLKSSARYYRLVYRRQ